jgi:thioredoxin
MAIFHLTESDFDTITGEGLSLIDFWADWCPPCKMLAPAVEELAERLDGAVRVCKVDVDSQPKLAERFGVSSIPTIIIIRDGVEINRGVGAMPIESLEALLG